MLNSIRDKIIFHLKQKYYPHLDIVVPFGEGFSCPVVSPEAWYSFQEIFLQEEYKAVFEKIPLPARWIDVGCHVGYFSFWVAWLWAKKSSEKSYGALLIDADRRARQAVRKIVDLNGLEAQWKFEQGAISAGKKSVEFTQRCAMASSVSALGTASRTRYSVPVLTAEKIIRNFPGPYDLIKVDIEGSEYDFLTAYEPVLAQTRHLVLEWHSWHLGGGGLSQIEDLARQRGFKVLLEVIPSHKVSVSGKTETCGVILFEKS
jgi:FkbM family methyltransferase